ncbi:TPR-like protein [Trametes gibbosa]|nr:TPR-like protein [Trametes gibbosa]
MAENASKSLDGTGVSTTLSSESVTVPASIDISIGESAVDIHMDIRKCLTDADELKQEGNEHFRAKRWNEALAAYKVALGRLPRRRESPQANNGNKGKAREVDGLGNGADDEDVDEQPSPVVAMEAKVTHGTITPEVDMQCAKARAVLNANIGACFMKLEDYKEAVVVCTSALVDDPGYVKALQRRVAANEKIGSWSSLSSVQEDYKQLLELLPASSPDVIKIRRSLVSLPPRIEAAQKQETAEMLDKLKGLGNSILGNFGLSTDNFQFVPNGQGGYSMNFVR